MTWIIAEWDDHGGIPEEILKLRRLQHLDLSYTAIRAVPQKIVQLRRLQTLNLNHCMLLESLSGELGKLPITCKSTFSQVLANIKGWHSFSKTWRIVARVHEYSYKTAFYEHSISIQSADVAPEVNLRITQVRKRTEGIHPGFETQGRRHQKSKTGLSLAPQKGLMSSKKFFLKKKTIPSGRSNWKGESFFLPVPMHHGIGTLPWTESPIRLKTLHSFACGIDIALVFYLLSALSIRSCPSLRTPPPEVVARGQESVIGYLKRLSAGFTENWRTKLMLVGLGGAGKTRWMKNSDSIYLPLNLICKMHRNSKQRTKLKTSIMYCEKGTKKFGSWIKKALFKRFINLRRNSWWQMFLLMFSFT